LQQHDCLPDIVFGAADILPVLHDTESLGDAMLGLFK
jgi:hypothetical protein